MVGCCLPKDRMEMRKIPWMKWDTVRKHRGYEGQ